MSKVEIIHGTLFGENIRIFHHYNLYLDQMDTLTLDSKVPNDKQDKSSYRKDFLKKIQIFSSFWTH